MNTRIQQFLAAENISQSQLADSLGVARASISHIVAGRNKPGFDFIENMARTYPSLNLEWLITGKGKMYKDSSSTASAHIEQTVVRERVADTEDLFSSLMDTSGQVTAPTPVPAQANPPQRQLEPEPSPAVREPHKTSSEKLYNNIQIAENKHNISKIIVFFDDGTYQELR